MLYDPVTKDLQKVHQRNAALKHAILCCTSSCTGLCVRDTCIFRGTEVWPKKSDPRAIPTMTATLALQIATFYGAEHDTNDTIPTV